MFVKEMVKGIIYDDSIKIRYIFLVCGKVVIIIWEDVWLRLVGIF